MYLFRDTITNIMNLLGTILTVLALLGLIFLIARILKFQDSVKGIDSRLQERDRINNEMKESVITHQLQSLKLIQESIQNCMADMRSHIVGILSNHADSLNKRMETLTFNADQKLKEISGQVEKRLSEGFARTTDIFTDVVKRLALIDEAQKKITELSTNVVDLQSILADKRSRGAFGEVQLTSLIRNLIPENNFELQASLSNGKRVDCLLKLPPPTGNIAIDAKFPLESYRLLTDLNLQGNEKRAAEQQFRADIKKHLHDVAEKYILPEETSDGAMMFIPAEAIFAEIHAHFYDLVELSHKLHVWLVSPTTMMAILTTARAVLKDAATRKQVHIIREHLSKLGKDFNRFQDRMDDLERHINQAHADIEQVHKSSKKISERFNKIELVELDENSAVEKNLLLSEED